MNTARSAALSALLHVEVEEGYSNLVLDKTLAAFPEMDPRDRALASALFYGVLERRITLDFFLSQFSKNPLEKLDPCVRELLRMGAYQILYMEKIPPSAAVNEAVNLAKAGKCVKASGFINAVLRSLIRNLDRLAMPDPGTEPLRYLSVTYSYPEWLISLWQRSYGEECTLGLLKATLNRPPLYARVNNTAVSTEDLIQKLASEHVKAQAITWIDNALSLEQTGAIGESPSFREGLFHIQDLSSQLCCLLVNPAAGQRVIDVCSAPGGKSFTLAERMGNRGEILAFDQYKGKVRLIREGSKRLKLSIISAAVRDAEAPAKALEPADRVLCDAPCSGLGIIRRKPEIRYKLQSSIDSLPDLQYRIVCESSKLVKSGGLLVYSTCTLNPAENGGVAERFLKSNSGAFRPFPLSLPPSLARAVAEPENQMTMMPHIHGTDGFFIAAFQKK